MSECDPSVISTSSSSNFISQQLTHRDVNPAWKLGSQLTTHLSLTWPWPSYATQHACEHLTLHRIIVNNNKYVRKMTNHVPKTSTIGQGGTDTSVIGDGTLGAITMVWLWTWGLVGGCKCSSLPVCSAAGGEWCLVEGEGERTVCEPLKMGGSGDLVAACLPPSSARATGDTAPGRNDITI